MVLAEFLENTYPDVDREVLRRCEELVGRSGIRRGVLYIRSRESGAADRFAAACAMQAAPRGMTDDVFWSSGRKHTAEMYGEDYFNDVKARLAAQGVTIGCHQDYLPELARYKGDPQAVVGHGARSHIKAVCESRGIGCEGAVNLKGSEPITDPMDQSVPLAPDLVKENFQRYAAENPDEAKKMTAADVTEAMTEKHGPPY